tara:strand:- start:572 stop:1129 length:558 start_codon:yes stop_codon:yes gene_type:complete
LIEKNNLVDIVFNQASSVYLVDREKVRCLVQQIKSYLAVSRFDVSLTITNDVEIKKLNETYRNKDRATDVLSFPQVEWEAPVLSQNNDSRLLVKKKEEGFQQLTIGDIVISLDSVEKNATTLRHGLDREFCFLVIHGLLHLCGHDHQEEEEQEIMFNEQTIILDLLSQEKDSPLWSKCVVKTGEK